MSERIIDKRKHKFVLVDNPVLLDSELSDAAFRLYCVLLKYAGSDNGCWPGITRLAKDMGKCEASIKRLLGELTNRGLISRQRRFKRSSITWIEDIEHLYKQPTFETCTENALSANISRHEQPTFKPTELDSDIDTMAAVVHILLEQGVDSLTAEKLGKTCTVNQVQEWLDYIRRSSGINNPQGFLIAKLRQGEYPPRPQSRFEDDPKRYIRGEFASIIQHGCASKFRKGR